VNSYRRFEGAQYLHLQVNTVQVSLLGLLEPKDEDNVVLRIVCNCLSANVTQHPGRHESSSTTQYVLSVVVLLVKPFAKLPL
jgi:hypothetical protein